MRSGADTTDRIETTRDAFLGGCVMVSQPKRGYRAGLDAVLLAASVAVRREGDSLTVLDLGAGVGVVGLAVARRLPMAQVTLLEREPDLVVLARRNVLDNGLGDRVSVIAADLAAAAVAASPVATNSFDHVLANPPFYADATCRRPQDPLRAAAHTMPAGGLEIWGRAMARLTCSGGRATIIHRADALPALLEALASRFGDLTLRPIHPRAGQPANRVLIQGRKGSRAPMRILPPLILHEDTNAFRPEIQQLLRAPGGLADIP